MTIKTGKGRGKSAKSSSAKKSGSKKTAHKKTKKTAADSTAGKKQPEWTLVTYEQIEARREQLDLSKSKMAEMLGVTNSTYHNWRRGTTVPHEGQQEKILKAMHSGRSIVQDGTEASASVAPKVREAEVPAVAVPTFLTHEGDEAVSDPFGTGGFLEERPANGNGVYGHANGDVSARGNKSAGSRVVVGGTRCSTRSESLLSHEQTTTRPTAESFPVASVARNGTIMGVAKAFIEASNGTASAASIIELCEGLARVLP